MSPVFDCTTDQGRADAIPKAAAGVRDGRLVVLPTDTLYGVGADAFSPDAVRALLEAKGRGSDMPPPVLVADQRTIDGLATDVPDYARALVDAFWPGPLTIVLRAQPSLMWDLGDTGGTVALRMPDDPVALELLREVGPMAVSSANRTGHPASRTVVEAASQLGATVEFYLDGGPATGRPGVHDRRLHAGRARRPARGSTLGVRRPCRRRALPWGRPRVQCRRVDACRARRPRHRRGAGALRAQRRRRVHIQRAARDHRR